ncbi:hypothetical protein M3629_07015 [Paenibacillus polysaccharolyticus]|uniref:hypothetical protein n=1 Tax=Paenibacillus polysaccharolyticus TaxID=582692 RepID=UPI000B8230FE|nr:hypothetical protein [Paenibacillus polysaccharolyticus]MCM3132530.1 hypothetical protein [Paenibacillus polysaccharolyticus]
MNIVELAIVLSDDPRAEHADLVALPFVPRKDELILWNNKLYIVTNVLYAFDTDPANYNNDAHPEKQSLVALDICYKVLLKPAR